MDTLNHPAGVAVTSAELLPMIRELYSRLPETRCLEPWELQHVLFSLGYVDDLADEGEIDAAVEVARTDVTGEAA